MDKKKSTSYSQPPFGTYSPREERNFSKRAKKYYTRNSTEHKRRSLNRTLIFEDLEDREVLSAISPVAANVPETTSLMDTTAVYAPATVAPETTTSVEMVPAHASLQSEAWSTPTPQEAEATDAFFATEEIATMALFQSRSTNSLFDITGGGAVPGNYRQSIPGIPGTDTGGVAGYNGGGPLPLQIPGFRGYGNAYYLDINDETLPRTVWLYAEYFRNQPRITPGQVWLVRPDIDYSWENYYFDGVRISTSVYSMITDQALEELKEEKIEDIMQQEKREEKVNTFLHKENSMEKQIPKTLREVPETEEIPETPDMPDTTAPPETMDSTETPEREENPSTTETALPPETDSARPSQPSPVEVPHPQEPPAYPIPQPQTPATPPIMDPPATKPMRSGDEFQEG
ncbi:MAG: hypothetical protein Q4D62_13630 [Planctomycetia bacterium]|nr:hypothetical protein [Planctomycetia bacterium]